MEIWLKRLAFASLLGFPLAVIGTRVGLFGFQVGILMVAATLVLALLIFAAGMTLTFMQRRSQPEAAKIARVAAYIALVPLIGIGWQLIAARNVPQIHNISTDVVDPPEFAKIAEIRSDKHNPLEYDSAVLAEVQQKAYPNVKTLYTDLSLEAAHRKAIVVAEALGWEVIDQDLVSGIVEATETTALWGFKDDVVIRVRRQADGKVAVDLRSVSRVGRSDLGANAKRIERFLAAYQK